jgi:hypothetical protein
MSSVRALQRTPRTLGALLALTNPATPPPAHSTARVALKCELPVGAMPGVREVPWQQGTSREWFEGVRGGWGRGGWVRAAAGPGGTCVAFTGMATAGCFVHLICAVLTCCCATPIIAQSQLYRLPNRQHPRAHTTSTQHPSATAAWL